MARVTVNQRHLVANCLVLSIWYTVCLPGKVCDMRV